MAKLNSGSVWQQSKYWLRIQTERSCYVCYCVLSVLSSQTQQQQQRRVLKKGKELKYSACLLHDVIPCLTKNKERHSLFSTTIVCVLWLLLALHSCHYLCCVNMSQLMFRQTSVELPGFWGLWLCAVSGFYLYTNIFGEVNAQLRTCHCASLH